MNRFSTSRPGNGLRIPFCAALALSLSCAIVQATDSPPSILSQPRNQSASLGADVTFRVTASSSSTVTFQWQQNQTRLLGATNSTLILTIVQQSFAGNYAVILSNNFGAVTSQVATLIIDATFTKITIGPVVNDHGDSTGTAWGDYDGDGNLDLFVSNFETPLNFLYHNNGDGNFTRITSGKIVTDGGNSTGCAWGDFDNDGFLDLFVANNGENNFLYHNNRDGTFTKVESCVRMASGDLQFMIRGARELNYFIESSTNLIQWSRVTLVTNVQAAIVVPKHLAASQCFYRAVETVR